MGAQKWVDVNRYSSVENCITELRHQGYQIIATTPHEKDSVLQEFEVTKKSCFFFGRETEGLSEEVLQQTDRFLKIPMVGFTESLNISVSAAIVLQYVMTKLKQSDCVWELSEEAKNEKKLDWIKKTIKSYDEIVSHYYSR